MKLIRVLHLLCQVVATPLIIVFVDFERSFLVTLTGFDLCSSCFQFFASESNPGANEFSRGTAFQAMFVFSLSLAGARLYFFNLQQSCNTCQLRQELFNIVMICYQRDTAAFLIDSFYAFNAILGTSSFLYFFSSSSFFSWFAFVGEYVPLVIFDSSPVSFNMSDLM